MRFVSVAAVLLWAGLIFFLSSLPSPPGQTGGEWQSYAAHGFVYFVLGWLTAHAGAANGLPGKTCAVLAVVMAGVYGASDEFHQSFVPERDASAIDWAFDVAGGAVAAAVWKRWRRRAGPGSD